MQNWILQRDDNSAVVELHAQYKWRDEYEWSPIAQSDPVYTLSGALDIQQGIKKAGRPITLDCEHARIKRGTVKQLQDWLTVPELEMTLTHPAGATFSVIFTRPALSDIEEVKPMRPEDQSDDDPMRANVHLITI